jgi:hypothetical protein
MRYVTVRSDADGFRVWVVGGFIDYTRAEQVHSYLGKLGAKKVFGTGDGLEGTYLLPPVVSVKLAVEG